ncbi:caspase family protein [Streptomyces sp. NPDC051907]|uniref:caspase family protein n=1 Tax=Streptomyces sp. NPDC051907 TaxID=3155284 RepID=UPI003431FF84
MTLRAVLIGAQTFGLTGVHTDIDVMQGVLARRGFTDVRVLVEDGAGYAGIKQALRQLRRDARSDDGVVVYFSGHGSLSGDLQYLVPVDIARSTPSDFRGYLAAELTAEMRALASITPNVTCVLDCCHSGGAVREAAYESGRWRLKSVELPRVPPQDGLARAAELARPAHPLVQDVVRLAACQQDGSAYETEIRTGAGRQGVFTAALAELLEGPAALSMTWSTLIARVRDRVKQQQVRQRPDAGGPSGRLTFRLEEPAEPERLPLERRDGRFVVPGGAVFGLGVEDRVRMVFPSDCPQETGPETGREAGQESVSATVAAMAAGDALLSPSPPAHEGGSSPAGSLLADLATAELPPGSYALPLQVHDRRLVRIDGQGPFVDELRRKLADSPRLAETEAEAEPLTESGTAAGTGTECGTGAETRPRTGTWTAAPAGSLFATVCVHNGEATVLNPDGLPFRESLEATPAHASRLHALLEELARGERVRSLDSPVGEGLLQAEVDVRFEVEDPAGEGSWRVLRPSHDSLYDGDRYRVSVANHSGEPLYFWVLGVGLSGRSALVTNDQPSGYRLEPAGAPFRSTRTTPSIRIRWPKDVPGDGPRLETVHLLVGDRMMDLSGLTSREARDRDARGPDRALGSLLQEVWDGVRDQEQEKAEEFRYRLWTVHADAFASPRPGRP